jgi:hypothetical protein
VVERERLDPKEFAKLREKSARRGAENRRRERPGPGFAAEHQRRKRPNALKHGVFSPITIIPGEHAEEFDELYSVLVEEWMPDGLTERETVLSLAKAIWRKRRIQKFIEVEIRKNMVSPDHESYDETMGLTGFATCMAISPEVTFERAGQLLRADKVHYLKQKFRRSNFGSTSEWAQAVIEEINAVLLPKSRIFNAEAADRADFILSHATMWGDLFDKELELEERLDATIDGLIKRLTQLKAVKSLVRTL